MYVVLDTKSMLDQFCRLWKQIVMNHWGLHDVCDLFTEDDERVE